MEASKFDERIRTFSDIIKLTNNMTLSAKVQQAKQKGAELYKNGKYSQSIEEYSIAIDNGDINDDELHLYYRYRQNHHNIMY